MIDDLLKTPFKLTTFAMPDPPPEDPEDPEDDDTTNPDR